MTFDAEPGEFLVVAGAMYRTGDEVADEAVDEFAVNAGTGATTAFRKCVERYPVIPVNLL